MKILRTATCAVAGLIALPAAADRPIAHEAVLDQAALGSLQVGGIADDQSEAVGLTVFQEEAPAEEGPTGKWESRFDLGASGSFGNTDTQGIHVGVVSKRETTADRTTLDAHYFFSQTNGDRDENRLTSGILQDWLVPDTPWLYFVQIRYDYDEFQSWEHRVSVHGGVGYHLIDQENFDLTLRGGLGHTQEFKEDNSRWEGLLGFDLVWGISDRQNFEIHSTVYPELEDPTCFRSFTTAAWAYQFDDDSNMSLNAGLQHEYQSDVGPGIDHNDWRIFAGLGFDF